MNDYEWFNDKFNQTKKNQTNVNIIIESCTFYQYLPLSQSDGWLLFIKIRLDIIL